MEDTKCSVGQLTLTECHKCSYVSKKGIENVTDLTEDNRILLNIRTEATEDLQTICLHHKSVFLEKFEVLQKACCDPLRKHKRPVRKSLRVVTVQQCKYPLMKEFKVKPGQKLCSQCRAILFKSDVESADSPTEPEDIGSEEVTHSVEKKETIEKLNSSLTEVGCSPLKLHALGEHSKASYGREKLEKFQANVQRKIQKVLEVEIPTKEAKTEKLVEEKAADMDKLVEIMKEKLTSVSRKKQIQLLTIPASLTWTRKKIQETFGVSDYAVRQAQRLVKEKGFLAEPDPRCGKKLKPEIIDIVRNFYESDEQSRVMPGMKDVVSIGKKNYKRKRLILGNLHELYSSFKWEYPYVKVGFSKFCALRPKWCVLAGASGTHSVCVCTIHQNVILLLHAAQIEDSYKDVMKFLVCEEAKRECMLRHCSKCPSKPNLVSYLESRFEDYEENDTIEFSQWVSTDRTQMIKSSSTLDDFIDDLAHKIEKLIPHSFIAKSQSSFLKNLKENVPSDTAIILMDFSENYSFTIQDEAQGYHWTSESCTVHPVVVHCRNSEGEKTVSSHCIISDDLKHDVNMVYKTQEAVVNFLKENFPHIRKIHYFSDGSAAQYKNKYNFLNLCLHEEDFQLMAQWSFFATSHGKSECDGIGGTAKRLARKESLQRPLERQITTTAAFFNFCETNITKVSFHFIDKDTVDSTRSALENRFKDVQTLPGTRSFHSFKPLDSAGTIVARRISADEEPSLTFNLKSCHPSFVAADDLYPGCYIACKYDHLWYFGMVSSVDKDEGDIVVKFLHPNGPSPSFYWPRREDYCAVPVPHVLAVVDIPQTTSGRTYHFSKDCMRSMEEKMAHLEVLLRKRN